MFEIEKMPCNLKFNNSKSLPGIYLKFFQDPLYGTLINTRKVEKGSSLLTTNSIFAKCCSGFKLSCRKHFSSTSIQFPHLLIYKKKGKIRLLLPECENFFFRRQIKSKENRQKEKNVYGRECEWALSMELSILQYIHVRHKYDVPLLMVLLFKYNTWCGWSFEHPLPNSEFFYILFLLLLW